MPNLGSCTECFDEKKKTVNCADCGLILCVDCLKNHECSEEDLEGDQ